MGVIATLLPHDGRVQRLRAAARERHAIAVCESWAELTRLCEHGFVQLVVFDLYADGAADFERVRSLKAYAPRAALVAYVEAARARPRDMFDAGRSGVDALVIADDGDSPSELAALIAQAEARSVASLLRPRLRACRPSVRDAALVSVTRAHDRLTPEALARVLAISRRLLARRLADAGFPAPHQLLTWGRLIVAAHLLEDTDRSADGVAAALDFPSGSAFRNSCRRYLGVTPHEIRANGGAAWVIDAMLREVAAAAALAGPSGVEPAPPPTPSPAPAAAGAHPLTVGRAPLA
jgi:AraC-like DNA-binding protein